MKIFQKVQGNLATNLYVTNNNKTAASASKPVASVDAMLTRMNVKTGAERLLKSFKTISANEALRLAEKQFGKMAEVKIARGLHSADAYDKASIRSAAGRHSDGDTGSFQFVIDSELAYEALDAYGLADGFENKTPKEQSRAIDDVARAIMRDTPANVDVKYDNTTSGPMLTFFGNVDDLEAAYDDVIEPIVGASWQEYAYDWDMLDTNDKHDSNESTLRHKASIRSAARSFKTARRKLSMQEKLRLIDEDRLEDDDFDL